MEDFSAHGMTDKRQAIIFLAKTDDALQNAALP